MTSPLAAIAGHLNELDLGVCRERRGAVYLLVRSNEIVYVGQTANLVPRIGLHLHGDRRSSVKKFDRVFWFACALKDLDAYEGALIRSLRPKYNLRAPTWKGRDNEILSALGLPPVADEKANADEWRRASYRPFGPASEATKRIAAIGRAARKASKERVRSFVEAAS